MGHVLHSAARLFSPAISFARDGFTGLRDSAESGAVLAGNYFLPGSSILTSKLASKGSQSDLNSIVGQLAQLGTGAAGSGLGQSITGLPSAAEMGGGWTNAANTIGAQFGDASLGTDIGNTASNVGSSIKNSLGFGGTSSNALPWLASSGSSGGLNLGSAALGFGAGNIASSLLSPKASSGSAGIPLNSPFNPSQQDASSLPPSLQSLGGLSPLQQATNVATGGVYGGGNGPSEQSYFTNLINRQLVDQSGKVGDIGTLNPIENSYLKQIGLGGYGNSTDLLQAISKFKPS